MHTDASVLRTPSKLKKLHILTCSPRNKYSPACIEINYLMFARGKNTVLRQFLKKMKCESNPVNVFTNIFYEFSSNSPVLFVALTF